MPFLQFKIDNKSWYQKIEKRNRPALHMQLMLEIFHRQKSQENRIPDKNNPQHNLNLQPWIYHRANQESNCKTLPHKNTKINNPQLDKTVFCYLQVLGIKKSSHQTSQTRRDDLHPSSPAQSDIQIPAAQS